MMRRKVKLFFTAWLVAAAIFSAQAQSSFAVRNGEFLLNGKPFIIRSGEIHYARVPHQYWEDRIRKAKALGLNSICTYSFWNAHEPQKGRFDFSTSENNLKQFVQLCAKNGMYVILRPGPYACAEWDLGGYPAWLLNEPGDVRLRMNDSVHMFYAKRYLKRWTEEIKPLLINNGGPVLMLQLENEYGPFGNDHSYLQQLYNVFAESKVGVPVFSCGWSWEPTIIDGTLPSVFPSVNFGNDAQGNFEKFNKAVPGQPQFCSEFWTGWFTMWEDSTFGRGKTEQMVKDLEWMLANNKSFNLYMLHGGTNFGFTSGANDYNDFNRWYPMITSYDYDAPINEAGGLTPRYFAMRNAIKKYLPQGADLPEPDTTSSLKTFVPIRFNSTASLMAQLPQPVRKAYPLPMEKLGQQQGYVLYRTILKGMQSGDLVVKDLHDYATVYLNGKWVGTIDRIKQQNSIKLPETDERPDTLELMVAALGHINFGPNINNDPKGITTHVLLNKVHLANWEMFSLPMNYGDVKKLSFAPGINSSVYPLVYKTAWTVDAVGDTYLDLSAFGSGCVYVNGHNLGRYWTKAGPQTRLFLPGCWLQRGANEVLVFDMEPNNSPKQIKSFTSLQ